MKPSSIMTQLSFINYLGNSDKIKAGDFILSETVCLPKVTGRVVKITDYHITIHWTNNEDIDSFSLQSFFSEQNVDVNRIRKTKFVIPRLDGTDTTAELSKLLCA